MEENTQKEIDTLKKQVKGWYNFYLRCADGHKYDQVHVEEFDEVVDQQLSPYLQELARCKHLDGQELSEIYTWLGEKHSELSKAISEIRPKEQEDPIITLIKNLKLNDGQKKAVAEYLKSEKDCNGDCENCDKDKIKRTK